MTKSMTAFSRKQLQTNDVVITWEVKAVNHRYLDLSFRLPDGFKELENIFRRMASSYLSRGKIECTLRCQVLGTAGDAEAHGTGIQGNKVIINHALAQHFIDELGLLKVDGSLNKTIEMTRVLALPDVMKIVPKDMEQFQPQAEAVFEQALEKQLEMRASEGARLAAFIEQRIQKIETIVAQLREDVPGIRAKLKHKIEAKLAEVVQEVDTERLEQEIVYAAQKMDVDEELDRLSSHIQEVQKLLKSDKPIGRRLDFLMQEFNREANTLGSKSQAAQTTNHAVDLKVLIEQMREQVQNIE